MSQGFVIVQPTMRVNVSSLHHMNIYYTIERHKLIIAFLLCAGRPLAEDTHINALSCWMQANQAFTTCF
jgi:hypothetical protein